jgi:uncharacterized phage-associated protein
LVFRFNIEKTIQAIAAFLHFHGSKEMSYLRMLKLLYLADRESLKETGRTITGDRVVAMEHGPVPSCAYHLLEALGRSADREGILQDARDHAAFDRLFAEETR